MTARRPHPGPQKGDRIISPLTSPGHILDRDHTAIVIHWDHGGTDRLTRGQFRAAFRPDGPGRWVIDALYLP